MSIESWKAEFYPIPVGSDAYDRHMGTKAIFPRDLRAAALAHSLHKWKGLRPEALKKHGLVRSGIYIEDVKLLRDTRDDFGIDSQSCSLCKHFVRPWECRGCPLYRQTGQKCQGTNGPPDEPFSIWTRTGNPEPMIEALQRALDREEERWVP